MAPDRTPTRANPYVGPRSFRRDAEEARLFFGREEEARQLLVRVQSERLTLFYAESGAGKSSLINTRLIPSLEERGFVVLPVGRVSGAPPAELTAEIDNIFAFNLMEQIDNDSTPRRYTKLTLHNFLERLVSEDGAHFHYDPASDPAATDPEESVSYVLIIDQFEELLTTYPGRWQEREDFFRQLDEAMRNDPNLWVVLSLREDFVASIEPYARLLADRMRGRFYMQRMQEQQALDAVRLPAQQYGFPFTPDAAQALVDNLRQVRVAGEEATLGQFVEPVQLQVVCLQLWESLNLSAGSRISLADLERMAGGRSLADFVDQALMDFYARSLAEVLADPAVKALPEVNEASLRRFFSQHLITELGTRGFVLQGESHTGGIPNVALHLLRDRYLLRAENRAGGVWYELVHDRFVEPILRANQQHQPPLTRVATLWAERQQDPWLLYRGAQLAAAQKELAAHPAQFGNTERMFLEASSSTENARRRSQRQLFTGLGLLVLLLLISLSAWAIQSRAEAIRLRAQAEDALATAEIQMVDRINAQNTAEAASTGNAQLTQNLIALLTAQAASSVSQVQEAISTPEAGTPTPAATSDLAITAVVAAVQTQIAQQAARDAASQVISQQSTDDGLYAVIPDIDMRIFSDPDANSSVLAQVRQPDRLPVIAVSGEWANVEFDGQTGWLRAIFTTYEGDATLLPENLRYLVTTNRSDLPYIRGIVRSFGGALGDWLLTDPTNQQSGYVWVPTDTEVTLLLSGKGLTAYGSGIWYFVMLVDPRNQAQVVKGWLPAEVIAEAG